ncbi:MAG: hypothetical protein RLZZ367_2512 [Bacteroidota bacterium]|jgi:tetratricopeptide (TPR) repeat protein
MKPVFIICISLLLLAGCQQTDNKAILKAHYTVVAANANRWSDHYTAAAAWQNLYALDNTNAAMLDSAFWAYSRIPNYKATAALGKDLLRAHVKHEMFMAALTTSLKENGEYQACIDAARIHVTLSTDTMPDYYTMALCFMELKQYPNAIGYMGRVLADTSSLRQLVVVKGQNVPYYAAALNVIGISEIKQGNMANGIKAFNAAVKAYPNFTAVKNNLNAIKGM